jgi:hypothetical protein
MGAGAGGDQAVGLKNRKRMIRLCERYGLVGVGNLDDRVVNIHKKRPPWSDRVGYVTFDELRHPDWPRLEDLVVSVSVLTGAWSE